MPNQNTQFDFGDSLKPTKSFVLHEQIIAGNEIVSSQLQKVVLNFFKESSGLEILESIDLLGYNKENVEDVGS